MAVMVLMVVIVEMVTRVVMAVTIFQHQYFCFVEYIGPNYLYGFKTIF